MKVKYFTNLGPVLYLAFCSMSALANNHAADINTRSFSVKLGSSRVIYNPFSNGESLTVTNPQNYPLLIQSKAFEEDKKTAAPFMVTPPIMRLDAQQSSQLRIVRTAGRFAPDRESLYFLCIKGIPPKADDLWAKNVKNNGMKTGLNIQISVNNCIKLLVRPDDIAGHPDDPENKLHWEIKNNRLLAINKSPYFITISSLKADDLEIKKLKYVEPFSFREFEIPVTKKINTLSWKIVNDYGGESTFDRHNVTG